ncbi:hypothetical protein G6L94_26130 [Agrobacterium rhizogenes]|nr:hypothetical protein [Rhizobium rhizogenes]NTI97170.1 hypothetical protein [Rhizobium rhizogenes]NTJ59561.1 hypothetical protein [Rhizobium rhizogenes]
MQVPDGCRYASLDQHLTTKSSRSRMRFFASRSAVGAALRRAGVDTNANWAFVMRLVLTRVFLGAFVGTASFSQAAYASDLLIWTPVKVAPRTYQTTIGFRLPMAWEMSAGADIGLGGAPGGKILSGSELATFWGRAVDDSRNFASKSRREIALRIDTLRGSGTLYLSRSRNWIVSKDLDMQTTRALNVNYVGAQSQPASVTASQGVTMIFPWTGTSISANGAVTDLKGTVSSTVAFNQPIAPNLNFTASVVDPLALTPAGNVNVNYRIKW